jgi:hypothetical protein
MRAAEPAALAALAAAARDVLSGPLVACVWHARDTPACPDARAAAFSQAAEYMTVLAEQW